MSNVPDITPHPNGAILPVKASPGAKKNEIRGVHDGQLRVAVTAAPERGKANAAIAKVLVGYLGVKKSQVGLLSGPTSGQKQFLIQMPVDELRILLQRLLADG